MTIELSKDELDIVKGWATICENKVGFSDKSWKLYIKLFKRNEAK